MRAVAFYKPLPACHLAELFVRIFVVQESKRTGAQWEPVNAIGLTHTLVSSRRRPPRHSCLVRGNWVTWQQRRAVRPGVTLSTGLKGAERKGKFVVDRLRALALSVHGKRARVCSRRVRESARSLWNGVFRV